MMAVALGRGHRARLSDLSRSTTVLIKITAPEAGSKRHSLSCFGMDERGVCQEENWVFAGQIALSNKSVALIGNRRNEAIFKVDLLALPSSVSRVIFCLSGPDLVSSLGSGRLAVFDEQHELCRFDYLAADFGPERAIIAGEIYFRDGWRFAAIGQGFKGGFPDLLQHVGLINRHAANPAESGRIPAMVAECLGYRRKQYDARVLPYDLKNPLKFWEEQDNNILTCFLTVLMCDLGMFHEDEDGRVEQLPQAYKMFFYAWYMLDGFEAQPWRWMINYRDTLMAYAMPALKWFGMEVEVVAYSAVLARIPGLPQLSEHANSYEIEEYMDDCGPVLQAAYEAVTPFDPQQQRLKVMQFIRHNPRLFMG